MIIGSKIKLRDKRLDDALDDYTWQTDPELTQLDAAPRLTIMFSQYLADYASELRYPSPTRHRFAVETLDGKHIGNCTYYDTNETKSETELGIMIGNRDYWDLPEDPGLKHQGAEVLQKMWLHSQWAFGQGRIQFHTNGAPP